MTSLIRFFVCSQRKNRSILSCSSTAALVVEAGTSFQKLWKNQYLLSTSFIFIPFNPRNCHWILVVVNISERAIGVLDPPATDTHWTDSSEQRGYRLGLSLMQIKFGLTDIKK